MNVRRGLFRTWLIFSVLFVLWVGRSSIEVIQKELRPKVLLPSGYSLMLPAECSLARGTETKDYSRLKSDEFCWYELPKFRQLYPEYSDLEDYEVLEKMYNRAHEIDAKQPKFEYKDVPLPWKTLFVSIGWMLGIPLLILVFGRALIWVGEGFRRDKQARP